MVFSLLVANVNNKRVDVVFDVYLDVSIKNVERSKRKIKEKLTNRGIKVQEYPTRSSSEVME